jgi:type II secretory pathway component GspD/PulD (secretin)
MRFKQLFSQLWTSSAGLSLALVLTAGPASASGGEQARLAFENADVHVVIAEVARLTGATFLFDPARVKGKITIVAAGDVDPAQALELLRSALALHGYVLVARPEGTSIVPAREVADAEFVVEVIRLTYANADDVAFTLGWAAPPGVRVVPFYPTNSVVISGPAAGVEQMLDLFRAE